MLKITHLIVDENYNIAGLTCEGRGRDFGEIHNDAMHKDIALSHLREIRFSNDQISVTENGITAVNGFKLNKLGMKMWVGGSSVDISNEITLVSRYVHKNENIGFGVTIGTNPMEQRFTYDNLIRLCNIFKPTNFVIRIGANGKAFIAGKSGTSISDLPAHKIKVAEKVSKRVTTAGVSVGPNTGTTLINKVDIFDLYEFITLSGGYIINFESTKYSAKTGAVGAYKIFTPEKMGEIGVPRLDFHASKFNINCNFKKLGKVKVVMDNGDEHEISTFIFRKKSIYYNGKNHLSKLGIVIPEAAEEEFINKFGRSMSVIEISNSNDGIVDLINNTVGGNNKVYSADTSKIAMITDEKIDSCILSTADLYMKVVEYCTTKSIHKYLSGLVRELKKAHPELDTGIQIRETFKMFNAEEQKKLVDCGLDLYTGRFNLPGTENVDSGKVGSDSVAEAIIEIAYNIDEINADKITYNQIANYDDPTVVGADKVPGFLTAIVDEFRGYGDPQKRFEKAVEMLTKTEIHNSNVKRDLWLHKCAMYIKSRGAGLHGHDRDNWELNTKKRMKKAKCYSCKAPGCESMYVAVSNIDLV